jgi:ATP-dependent Clp protease adaptor protein ClpS
MYKVLLHNDNYTSMEFVVLILEQVFHRSESEAQRIMMEVHRGGVGVAGIYTKEIAETKVAVVQTLARQHEFPLRCTVEPL